MSMRKTVLVLNSIVAVFFAGFVAYTFFARQHLNSLARDFVTDKTIHYSKPIVDVAEESLNVPLVRKLLSDKQASAIRDEIADYRTDPSAYVADLTRQAVRIRPLGKPNPLLANVALIKENIRTFYDDTLTSLIKDLRIFSVSNLIAGVIAFWLAYRSTLQTRSSVVVFSLLMSVAVLDCSYMYVDHMTFFRILFRMHLGWWYPIVLCVSVITMYYDRGRDANTTQSSQVPETVINPEHTVESSVVVE